MKTHFSNAEYAKKVAQQLQKLASSPPPIPFEKPKKDKAEKKESEDKTKVKTFNVKIDKDDKDSETVEYHIKAFEHGTPKEYVQWLESYKEIEKAIPLEKPKEQVNVLRTILKETFLETFNNSIPEGTAENPITEKDVTTALSKVTLKAFNNDRHAYRRQVQYMRYHLYFNTNNFKEFEHRLKKLNK